MTKQNLYVPVEIFCENDLINSKALMDRGADISTIQVKHVPKGYLISEKS